MEQDKDQNHPDHTKAIADVEKRLDALREIEGEIIDSIVRGWSATNDELDETALANAAAIGSIIMSQKDYHAQLLQNDTIDRFRKATEGIFRKG